MIQIGSLHPETIFLRQMIAIFNDLGFSVFESPEADSEWYNFDAVNVPKDHPSRDVQDTFWLKDGRVLRTHTSNGQVRYGEMHKPPLKIVIPGRCYRNEATDARHENTFTQLEGLYIDKDVRVGHLFWTIRHFLKKMYGDSIEVRFRPHHYPFVEPGMDIDIKYQGQWLEVLGSGMVHPKVMDNMRVDSGQYSGFAFGLGVTRLVMLKYGIGDIRQFNSGDLRFLRQFHP
ncbi:MAG: phenylalanine--tRNA ligase subunit alpha [Patescibacteria group bacterium]